MWSVVWWGTIVRPINISQFSKKIPFWVSEIWAQFWSKLCNFTPHDLLFKDVFEVLWRGTIDSLSHFTFICHFFCPSVTPSVRCILGAVRHLILIFGTYVFGTLVLNDDIFRSFLHIFKILTFWVVSLVKGQKMAQNDKMSVIVHISWTKHHNCNLWYTSVKRWYLQVFFHFSKFWFCGLLGG